MLLSFEDLSVFHVEHPAGGRQIGDFGFEGRHPNLRGYVPDQLHKPRKVLAIQLGGWIVEKQRGTAWPFGLLDLELRQHECGCDELLLTARHAILRGPISDLNQDIAPMRSELSRAIPPIPCAISPQGIQ